ncbi:hypothetical protein FJW06_05375 [Mesorhizobium sp. B4-1-3]|uniref:hypothetical protein n=1 Tax=Mesorhizobium sp. B4-1-3 TaxID=2589889 RepID=UPI001128410D|nr:hypothetical protein [Mesorhizobium sp. B4-1-3]TPI15757.1 hypothetical protein FJW06_05375 [Mesorhizobium sp. B4-1-3]
MNRQATMAKLQAIATSPQSPTLASAARLQRDADSIAVSMTALHGGKWVVKINHGCHFVLVKREID